MQPSSSSSLTGSVPSTSSPPTSSPHAAAVVFGTCNVLHAAAEDGNVNKIKELSLRPDIFIDAADDFGQRAIHYAAVFGRDAALEALCEAKADVNGVTAHRTTPLHYAARNGHLKCVEILLKYHAKPNAQDLDQWTPLHFACFRGHNKTSQLLIESGASITLKTIQGQTPLQLACNKGNTELADYLQKLESNS